MPESTMSSSTRLTTSLFGRCLPILSAGILGLAVLLSAGCGGEEGGDMVVTNLDPRAGATQGQQRVRVIGQHFRPEVGYTVYFGNKRAPATSVLDSTTLLVTTPQRDESGPVDVVIVADNGPAYRISAGFQYEDMGGNVMEHVGEAAGSSSEDRY
jgi:hypothetical protein